MSSVFALLSLPAAVFDLNDGAARFLRILAGRPA